MSVVVLSGLGMSCDRAGNVADGVVQVGARKVELPDEPRQFVSGSETTRLAS